MISFRPIGCDFGDPVPPTPASPDSGEGGPAATRLPSEDLPEFQPEDIARAMLVGLVSQNLKLIVTINRRLSLAACGLVLSNDPALAGMSEGDVQPATLQDINNNVLALGGWYAATAPEQTGYSLRPARSLKPTQRAQYSLRRH